VPDRLPPDGASPDGARPDGARDGRGGPALVAALVGAVVVPVAALALWASRVADRLPDPVATHWGLGGTADGFASLGGAVGLAAGLVVLLGVPFALAGWFARPVPLRRCLAALGAALPVWLVLLVGDSLRTQLDLPTAAAAPSPTWGLFVGTTVGVFVGVMVARLVPAPSSEARRASAPPPTDLPRLGPGHARPWSAPLPRSRAMTWVLGLAAAVLMAIGAVAGLAMFIFLAVLAAALVGASLLRMTVTAEDGLVVRAAGLVPLLRIRPDEIASASVTEADPYEFGGWGIRIDLDGRVGVVTRRGEAVRVVRGDDSEVVLTVDDAATAAASLNSAADRAHRA